MPWYTCTLTIIAKLTDSCIIIPPDNLSLYAGGCGWTDGVDASRMRPPPPFYFAELSDNTCRDQVSRVSVLMNAHTLVCLASKSESREQSFE
jgi:hypothetical protein